MSILFSILESANKASILFTNSRTPWLSPFSIDQALEGELQQKRRHFNNILKNDWFPIKHITVHSIHYCAMNERSISMSTNYGHERKLIATHLVDLLRRSLGKHRHNRHSSCDTPFSTNKVFKCFIISINHFALLQQNFSNTFVPR